MKLQQIFPRIIGEAHFNFDLLEDINKIRDNPSGTPKRWVSNKTYSTFGKDLWDYPSFRPFLEWQDSQVTTYCKDQGIKFEQFNCQSQFICVKDLQVAHIHTLVIFKYKTSIALNLKKVHY